MSIADELSKLEDLRRRGVLSETEFAQAKAAVLAGGAAAESPVAEQLSEQLAEVRHQNDLARLDREWEIEREQYMITGHYGRRYLPTAGGSLVMAVLVGIFGVGWTIFAISLMSSFPDDGVFAMAKVLFPLFGVLFTCFAVGMGIYGHSKAQKYAEAHERYRQRRAALSREPVREPEPTTDFSDDDRVTKRWNE